LSALMNYKDHLKSSDSLVTPYEEIRAGFIALALEKNRKASPFVEEAKVLKVLASKASNPQDLLSASNITAIIVLRKEN